MQIPDDAWPNEPPGAKPDLSADEAMRYAGTPAAHTWTALFGLALALMAFDSILQAIDGIKAALNPDGSEAQNLEEMAELITPGVLWLNSAFILFIFGFIPIAWVALTRVKAWATWRYLHMSREDIWKKLGLGAALGIGMWLTMVVLTVIQLAITGELDSAMSDNATQDSPVSQALIDNINWPLAFFIAAVAGFAEEVFFRGVLQRWIGVWGQAAVFGVTHAGYGTLAQIFVPFGIGLLLGYLVKRGHGLWLVIAAHFMFDFVQFALVLLFGTG